mmetsp:Transcript_48706/g.56183  ORF Transcript_48706/g.56183 Transcript_48706/m.56183 type:complete len:159 (+) Transcript_48706:57-533(+)|eukprot:CAMPEP_0176426200 /NCGR_PEP_ID=MMETSP0127-20121128/11811_1 /TAXON_ID=938130 /ORGANISM="Platyophrya macrostoma, Strain WH" /LENGTH=158 /DNA_ID=CAMNT_0017807443 /DNA_START=56 /DNA_END=532 /DNA_ORIENTATION=-
MESYQSTGLSEAQHAERERIAEIQHREFLRSLATSHSVKMQQSSVAGASAKTNQVVRMAEEQEAERQARLRAAAQATAADKAFLANQAAKNDAIAKRQAKKRAQRLKKQNAKQTGDRKRSRSTSCSDDSDMDEVNEDEAHATLQSDSAATTSGGKEPS